jgi:hypothetical protein
MKHLHCEWRRLVVAAVLAIVGSLLVATNSSAQSSEGCRAYAEDYSYRYSADSIWADVFRIRGRRATVNAVAADRSRRLKRSTLFDNAYARCMRDRWP